MLTIINPGDRDWTKHRYVLAFGAYGEIQVLVWANGLDDALDGAIDWASDHAPGLLCDEQVREAYLAALDAGKSEEAAQEEAEVDTTSGGNEGHYILSHEWSVVAEDPDRATLKAIVESQGGAAVAPGAR